MGHPSWNYYQLAPAIRLCAGNFPHTRRTTMKRIFAVALLLASLASAAVAEGPDLPPTPGKPGKPAAGRVAG
jgi:hypothetical protein